MNSMPENIYFEVIEGVDEGKHFPILNGSMTIGRDPVCEIILNDESVSRKHAQIVFRVDHFTLVDLNSLNKSVVNGMPNLEKNLNHEDIIRLGKTKVIFYWKGQKKYLSGLRKERIKARKKGK